MKKIKTNTLFVLCAFLFNLGCSEDESVNETTNTAPVVADQSFSIAENNAVDAVIGQIVATDAEGDNLIFSGANSVLSIAADGEITALAAFDFETTTSHTITVTVSDGELSNTCYSRYLPSIHYRNISSDFFSLTKSVECNQNYIYRPMGRYSLANNAGSLCRLS